MLPHSDLKRVYDKAIWLYVYRDFSKSADDRAAERIMLRFGVTSWPQLFLADPHTWKVLSHTGRQVQRFVDVLEKTSVKTGQSTTALEDTKAAEARAIALEKKPTKKLALAHIDDADIVVRYRALEVLADKDLKAIAPRALSLLEVPNDPFRFKVCEILKGAADTEAAPALEALVREPTNSLNPNVLRIRAVQALATCGRPASVEAIAPHAQSGAWFNGLTGISIDTLAALAKKHKKARKAVQEVLRQSYPVPPDPSDARADARVRGAGEAGAQGAGVEEEVPGPVRRGGQSEAGRGVAVPVPVPVPEPDRPDPGPPPDRPEPGQRDRGKPVIEIERVIVIVVRPTSRPYRPPAPRPQPQPTATDRPSTASCRRPP